ncbi:MAG: hypothetical protein A3F13_04215 [Gammaproteobacteria bacterium RIFCSPHIGHO2_12_FULL_40_19]|nr:MAG: hypothetical protein A3F13_04215 [Gammaproteobacteria bacterium RIFCSPHIGHO2_12_FULL_40_19]
MIQGHLKKMSVLHTQPIQYQLILDNEKIALNNFLNQKISIEFLGEIHCIQCGRKTKQSFQQGFCFPCMQKINECNNCMIHPERCLVESGKCDSSHWAHHHCHQPQIVYLANSSGIKVGVTQIKNNPSRWIDQGAAQALPIFQTTNRYQAGILEVALKSVVADKTNWRTMLKEQVVSIDLIAEKKRLLSEADNHISPILKKYPDSIIALDNKSILEFQYPVLEYPQKITALSLDKTPKIEGVLQGIKGQYLMLNTGLLNVRKFGGYRISFQSI